MIAQWVECFSCPRLESRSEKGFGATLFRMSENTCRTVNWSPGFHGSFLQVKFHDMRGRETCSSRSTAGATHHDWAV